MTKYSTLGVSIPLPEYQKNPEYEKLERGFFPLNDEKSKNFAQCLIEKDVQAMLLNFAVCKNNQKDLVSLIESFNQRELKVIEEIKKENF